MSRENVELLRGRAAGAEGLRRALEVFWREFDEAHVEVHELIDAGDQALEAAGLG